MRRNVKANLAPSGNPWKIEASGNRIRVAANEPPKITMAACIVRKHAHVAAEQDEGCEDAGAGEEP